jgi:site-specific DNA-adenine methylase
VFLNNDFSDIWSYIKDNTFVYCDPPYFITLGSYNDGKRGFEGWTQMHETKLYQFLDELDMHGVKFMLSNVLTHKGKTNTILQNWLKSNNYKMFLYEGVSRGDRKEILVTNYEVEQ